MGWELEDQKRAFEAQVRLAKTLDVPFILHTPTPKKARDFMHKLAESGLPAKDYKRHYLDMDMEIINRVGLDHKRLVIDHVDETILDYCLKETKAYLGIGVGQTLRHTNPIWFADVVEEHGSERLMINSDHIAYVGNDMMAIPKAVREMLRRGISRDAIVKAVFGNANTFYQLQLKA